MVQTEMESVKGGSALELLPLQQYMLEETRKAFRRSKKVILQAGCGAGKTIIACQISKNAIERGKTVLFIADRIVLCNQTSDVFIRYGVPHGVIQAQNPRFDLQQPCQVCSIQTLKMRGCPKSDVIIIDECFHGDTKISTPTGSKQIKFVKLGDLVYNAYGVGEVRSICISKNKLMKVRLSNGKTISCTENHPFFTYSGWKAAGKLDVGERLFSAEDLSRLWEMFPSYGKSIRGREGKGYRVREEMGSGKDLFRILCKENEQPNAGQYGCQGKTQGVNERKKIGSERGKRDRKCLPGESLQSTGGGFCNGIYSADEDQWGGSGWGSVPLQDRRGKSGENDRYRSGREFTSDEKEVRAGREEGLFVEKIRVAGVEIEQGRGESTVYNLEISRHPSYFAEGVLVHNCHVLHDAHKEIMRENPDSFILGLSASPYTKGLGKYFDFHIQPVPVKKLIQEGYLVPFDVYGPSIADLSKLKIQAGEYTEESLSETFDKVDIVGDVVRTWKKLTPGRKTIVFGVNVAHIKHLRDQFINAGISACQINAYQSEEERNEALEGFIHGNTTVLCSVEVATKGFNAPEVDVAVLAVATKSMIKWTQTTGRAFRTYPGKTRATILDLGGNCERLGFPDDYEFFGLDDGKKKKASEKVKKPRLPKVCPSCDFVKPIGVRTCPACGFTPDFKQDVEVAEGELKKLQRKVVKEYSIEQKQSFLAQLTQYAADHGMKEGKGGCFGWAIHQYINKFGVQPSGKIDWSRREPVGEEVSRYITYCNIKYAKRRII